MKKLLTQAQALSVYDAMTNMNNVAGHLHVRIPMDVKPTTKIINVKEFLSGEITVWLNNTTTNKITDIEQYLNQDAFSKAYALDYI